MDVNEMLDEVEEQVIGETVKSAYPGPSAELKQNVMQRINTERTLKRRRLSATVRWGSIAAAVLIIAGLGFRVLPLINKGTVKTASADSAAETVEEKYMLKADSNTASGTIAKDIGLCDEAEVEAYCEEDSVMTEESFAVNSEMPCETVNEAAISANSLDLAIVPENFAAAFVDVDNDGNSEFVVLRDVDGEFFSINAERGGDTLYTAEYEYGGADYSFEHIDGRMILRAYRAADSSVNYFTVEASAEDMSLLLVPYNK